MSGNQLVEMVLLALASRRAAFSGWFFIKKMHMLVSSVM